MNDAQHILPVVNRDDLLEDLVKRTPIPPHNPISPQKAQALLEQAQTPDQIKEVVYKFAADHGLFSNVENHPKAYRIVQDWRRGAV